MNLSELWFRLPVRLEILILSNNLVKVTCPRILLCLPCDLRKKRCWTNEPQHSEIPLQYTMFVRQCAGRKNLSNPNWLKKIGGKFKIVDFNRCDSSFPFNHRFRMKVSTKVTYSIFDRCKGPLGIAECENHFYFLNIYYNYSLSGHFLNSWYESSSI